MKIKLLIILMTLLLSCLLLGCGLETIRVNVNNQENIHNTTFGENALISIGNGLYYDSMTRIVYWWNGSLSRLNNRATTPSPYYAPNGLPYKYNPETNTFEEIDWNN